MLPNFVCPFVSVAPPRLGNLDLAYMFHGPLASLRSKSMVISDHPLLPLSTFPMVAVHHVILSPAQRSTQSCLRMNSF